MQQYEYIQITSLWRSYVDPPSSLYFSSSTLLRKRPLVVRIYCPGPPTAFYAVIATTARGGPRMGRWKARLAVRSFWKGSDIAFGTVTGSIGNCFPGDRAIIRASVIIRLHACRTYIDWHDCLWP